jgi:hypothetical protein
LRGLPLPPASSCTDLRLHVRQHLLLGLSVFWVWSFVLVFLFWFLELRFNLVWFGFFVFV